jgi:hypothetical protein
MDRAEQVILPHDAAFDGQAAMIDAIKIRDLAVVFHGEPDDIRLLSGFQGAQSICPSQCSRGIDGGGGYGLRRAHAHLRTGHG